MSMRKGSRWVPWKQTIVKRRITLVLLSLRVPRRKSPRRAGPA